MSTKVQLHGAYIQPILLHCSETDTHHDIIQLSKCNLHLKHLKR